MSVSACVVVCEGEKERKRVNKRMKVKLSVYVATNQRLANQTRQVNEFNLAKTIPLHTVCARKCSKPNSGFLTSWRREVGAPKFKLSLRC